MSDIGSYNIGYQEGSQSRDAEITRLRVEVERLTRERDFARYIISKCADALGNGASVGKDCSDDFRALLPSEIGLHVASLTEEKDTWKERTGEAEVRADSAERKLAMAVEALRKLAKASARLSVAAQTTGGVAGRDEGLCAEIDRLAQPLGEARATLAALEKNDE